MTTENESYFDIVKNGAEGTHGLSNLIADLKKLICDRAPEYEIDDDGVSTVLINMLLSLTAHLNESTDVEAAEFLEVLFRQAAKELKRKRKEGLQ